MLQASTVNRLYFFVLYGCSNGKLLPVLPVPPFNTSVSCQMKTQPVWNSSCICQAVNIKQTVVPYFSYHKWSDRTTKTFAQELEVGNFFSNMQIALKQHYVTIRYYLKYPLTICFGIIVILSWIV